MAIMIPGKHALVNSKSNGEKIIFSRFSEKDIPGYALYSVLQNNHRSKLTAEVDFLYICRRGILCIEVKGGRIGRDSGQWYSVDRNDIRHDLDSSPFRQADGCAYCMRNLLEKTYGKGSFESRILVGFAVAFPECIFTGGGDGVILECMFDNRGDGKKFADFINSAFDYWENEYIVKWNYRPQQLSEEKIEQMKDLLRGDFESIEGLALSLQAAEKTMISLTEQQYRILDVVGNNSKLLVEGPAGTGKTLLGVEMLRRNVMEGSRVLFLCYNRNLASYIRGSLSDSILSKCNVTTLHGYVKSIIGDMYVDDPNPVSVIDELDFGLLSPEQYDLIILDEAQDLMYFEVFSLIDRVLKGGLEYGRCIVFADPNQNIFALNNCNYIDTCNWLRSDYKFFSVDLQVNCRNTEKIAKISAKISHVKLANTIKIGGPKVNKYVFEGERDFFKKFSDSLTNLIRASGFSPKDIVVLSKYRKHNSLLKNCDLVCGLKLVERYDISEFSDKTLNYFTIQSFKGLESKVVFLIDIDGFNDKESRKLNYVGASRAKYMLNIFFDCKYSSEYDEMIDSWEE